MFLVCMRKGNIFFGISVLRGIYWVKMWQEISLGIHVYFELFAIVFK